jgi:hypothetical protein
MKRASQIPTAKNFHYCLSVAADEAAPIFVRFYIGTSRQPRVDRLETLRNQ